MTGRIQTQNIKITSRKKIEWLSIVDADKKEIAHLRRKYKFNTTDLHDAHSNVLNFHAKINAGDDYVFVTMRFPYFDKENRTVNGTEVDFFVGKDYLVMLHYGKITDLKKLFTDYEKKKEFTNYKVDSSIDLFYIIIHTLLDDSFDLLDHISEGSDKIEDYIFNMDNKIATTTLLNLRRSVVNMKTITQNYQNIFEKFKKLATEIDIIDKRTPYTTVIEKTKDLLNMMENRSETIKALYETNESIMNYRLNDVMKTLTIFSVIVFPLTLLAAIFGMNTLKGMPFIETEQGFWMIISIMLAGSLGMLVVFKKKKWL